MKKLLKISALLMAVAIAFSSCTKEQSSMNIEDIPYKATLKGCLVYDMGQSYSNGKYVQMIKPASGVKVTVRVENSQLDPRGLAQGYTVYADTTDANGQYEVEVPSTSNGVTVKVKPETFTGTYSEVESISNGTPVMKQSEVYYEVTEKTVTIVPGDLAVCDAVYTSKNRSAFDQSYDYNLSLQVITGQNNYEKKYDKEAGKYVAKRDYVPAKNVDITIDVEYESEVKTFMATSNNDGIATFFIPAKEQVWNTYIKFNAKTYAVSTFNFCKNEYDDELGKYVTKEYVIEGGTFEQKSPSTNTYKYKTLYSADEVFVATEKISMIFYPFVSVDAFGYYPSDWDYITF